MTTVHLAYLAGLFDGEGCIHGYIHTSSAGTKLGYVKVSLAMTSRIGVQAFQYQFGGSISVRRRKGYKKSYSWCLGNRASVDMLRQVLPFLQVKRREAELAISIVELMKKERSCYGLSSLVLQRRLRLVKNLSALKRSIG